MNTQPIERRELLKGGLILLGGAAMAQSGLLGCSGRSDAQYLNRDALELAALQQGCEALAAAGCLAMSAHNTQPWLLAVGQNEITLFADLSRHMPGIDALGRELHISLGCMLENICQAAQAKGLEYHIDSTSDTLPEHAILRFTLSSERPPNDQLTPHHPLFTRQTNRAAYKPQNALPPHFVRMLTGLAGVQVIEARSSQGQTFAIDTLAATKAITEQPQMQCDEQRWWRDSRDEYLANGDGVHASAAGLSKLKTQLAEWFPLDQSQAAAYWLKQTESVHLATARAYLLIATPDYHSSGWLEVGRIAQRAHLLATQHGVAFHPINQLPEMADWPGEQQAQWQARARHYLGDGLELAFTARLGYSDYQGPKSLRREFGQVQYPSSSTFSNSNI